MQHITFCTSYYLLFGLLAPLFCCFYITLQWFWLGSSFNMTSQYIHDVNISLSLYSSHFSLCLMLDPSQLFLFVPTLTSTFVYTINDNFHSIIFVLNVATKSANSMFSRVGWRDVACRWFEIWQRFIEGFNHIKTTACNMRIKTQYSYDEVK